MKQLVFSGIVFIVPLFTGLAQEICDNNLDDDGDRLIDLYDREDCPCIRDESMLISLVPNPSFELLNCIPQQYSQMACAQEWSQATMATSDLLSTEGMMPQMVPLPLPDGNACVGTIFSPGWMEYIGTCLTEPLRAGQSYALTFQVAFAYAGEPASTPLPSNPVALTLFGTNGCADFPVATTACPVEQGWQVLGSVRYTPKSYWTEVSMLFKPLKDFQSIMLGPPCELPNGYSAASTPYVMWDKLHLNRTGNEVIYYVPNAFTPNGDEFNQVFKPVFVCGDDPGGFLFTIFDRWGQEVFSSADPEQGWGGTVNGMPAPADVYAWRLTYKARETAEAGILNGHVVLIR